MSYIVVSLLTATTTETGWEERQRKDPFSVGVRRRAFFTQSQVVHCSGYDSSMMRRPCPPPSAAAGLLPIRTADVRIRERERERRRALATDGAGGSVVSYVATAAATAGRVGNGRRGNAKVGALNLVRLSPGRWPRIHLRCWRPAGLLVPGRLEHRPRRPGTRAGGPYVAVYCSTRGNVPIKAASTSWPRSAHPEC